MKENYLDEIIKRANEAMGKKLSTKERKKLKKSTFCGPLKSFPVEQGAGIKVGFNGEN